jgi:hypothetical protein
MWIKLVSSSWPSEDSNEPTCDIKREDFIVFLNAYWLFKSFVDLLRSVILKRMLKVPALMLHIYEVSCTDVGLDICYP